MYDVKYSGAAEKYLKKVKDKILKTTFKSAIDNLVVVVLAGTRENFYVELKRLVK